MKVFEVINRLSKFDPNSKVEIIVDGMGDQIHDIEYNDEHKAVLIF